MEHLLSELADLPPRLLLDGELVAWGEDRLPSFPRLCERMLQGKRGIPVAYMVFDVLEWEGHGLLNWTFRQRRKVLDKLNLRGSHWDTATNGIELHPVMSFRGTCWSSMGGAGEQAGLGLSHFRQAREAMM